MGLEDNSIIVNCITDDVFLSEFERLEQEQDYEGLKTILEEKIDKRIKQVELQNKKIADDLESVKSEKDSALQETSKSKGEHKVLEEKFDQTKEELRIFKNEFEKLKNKKSSVISEAIQLEIASSAKNEVESLEVKENENVVVIGNEQIINWSLLRNKLSLISDKIYRLTYKTLSTINVLIAVLFAVIACADIKNNQNYFLIAGLEPICLGIFKLNEKLKDSIPIKILIQVVVLILLILAFILNYPDIQINLNKIWSFISSLLK